MCLFYVYLVIYGENNADMLQSSRCQTEVTSNNVNNHAMFINMPLYSREYVIISVRNLDRKTTLTGSQCQERRRVILP